MSAASCVTCIPPWPGPFSQVPLPKNTKFSSEDWALEKNFDEGVAALTDGFQHVNLKSYFLKQCKNEGFFDYYNVLVKLKAQNKLPKGPSGSEEYVMEQFTEARPLGSFEAGGYRNPAVKKSPVAKKKASGASGALGDDDFKTPTPKAKRRRVCAPGL